MRVLVVEDDGSVREAIRRALLLEGWQVTAVERGEDGLEAGRRGVADVILLDVGLPGLDGLEVCRRLRQEGIHTPILMLTARVQVDDRIAGLDAGADDYVLKPYVVGELRARIRALARRPPIATNRAVSHVGIELDALAFTASIKGRPLQLTRTEFSLLEVFLRHPDQVLTAETIYDEVWGYDFGGTSASLRVYVGYLRRKLEAGGEARVIHTQHGVGYVLRAA